MTYTIHIGMHAKQAKNDEFTLRKWPNQPLTQSQALLPIIIT